MNAVDTNVLIYRLEKHDPVKRAKARALLRTLRASPGTALLLWQVAGELLRYLRGKQDQGLITRPQLVRYIQFLRRFFPLALPTEQVLDRALDLTGRYSLSHWDSMLLGACLEANVDTLYTEDMGAPTSYDTIQLVNPFL
jgi:predicted nucleic acid-binding protein